MSVNFGALFDCARFAYHLSTAYNRAMAEKLIRLYKTLKDLLEMEERHIRKRTVVVYELQAGGAGDKRDVTVAWLADKFQRTPHSLVLAVNYLDRFLADVKVQPKYMKCVAAACYFIAAKVVCEKELPPKASSIVTQIGFKVKPQDLIRMERLVLDKLNFKLNAVTPLHFIRMYHALVFHHGYLHTASLPPTEHLDLVIRRLDHCLQNNHLMTFRPSILALALVMSELKQLPNVDWLGVCLYLQHVAQIPGQNLSACYKAVQEYFASNHTMEGNYSSACTSTAQPVKGCGGMIPEEAADAQLITCTSC